MAAMPDARTHERRHPAPARPPPRVCTHVIMLLHDAQAVLGELLDVLAVCDALGQDLQWAGVTWRRRGCIHEQHCSWHVHRWGTARRPSVVQRTFKSCSVFSYSLVRTSRALGTTSRPTMPVVRLTGCAAACSSTRVARSISGACGYASKLRAVGRAPPCSSSLASQPTCRPEFHATRSADLLPAMRILQL